MALRRRLRKAVLFTVIIATLYSLVCSAKKTSSLVSDVKDAKDFKKLMKTKSNVLILFVNQPKRARLVTDIMNTVAEATRGQGTLCRVDCTNSEYKKLCKRLKISDELPYYIKHFKHGEYHKDYDRAMTVSSMTTFVRDPTGDIPWEEDPAAVHVTHLSDSDSMVKFLRKAAAMSKRCLILYYAPWCSYCRVLKPDYIAAATELKGEAMFAVMDGSSTECNKIRKRYNITGFPTILYFEQGAYRFPYNGDNKKKAIVEFMRDLSPQPHKKEDEDENWPGDGSNVVALTGANFASALEKVEHGFVVFYAPWCGHCKRIKPELEKAATRIKNDKINGLIGAVDATRQPSLAKRFGITGYPTLKYFSKGQYKYDVGHARKEEEIVNFMKDPQEPPPPPPPEEPWSEQETPIRHLGKSNFRSTLRRLKHAMVMFYAPWCGHCKSAKPEFIKAAEAFADDLLTAFCAVDCTTEQDLCATYDVKGYPTIKYFQHYDGKILDYSGGRKETDFISFVHTQSGSTLSAVRSQVKTVSESGFGEDVQIAIDADFQTLIDRPEPTFVMFYASWCTTCPAVKPTFSKVATKLKKKGSSVVLAAVDASENVQVADLAQISSVPVFQLYSEGKLVATYDGARTEEGFYKFCNQHAKVNDEL